MKKPRMCDRCGKHPAERMVRLGMRLQGDAAFDHIIAAEDDILLCIKGGCFLKFKESYWRLHKKYTRLRRQEVPE